MSELFTDPGQAFMSGYKASTTVMDDAASKSILQDAYKGASPDEDQSDIFSSAAKTAMQQGKPQLAEKFTKQATDSAKSKYEQQSYKAASEIEKLSKFEQDLQMLTTPQEALEYVMDKDLPMQQKMQIVSQLRGMGTDQGAFKDFKKRITDSVQDASTRTKGELAYYKAQMAHEDKEADRQLKRDKLKAGAGSQAGKETKRDERDRTKFNESIDKEVRTLEDKRDDEIAKLDKQSKHPLTKQQKSAKKAEINRRYQDKIDRANKARKEAPSGDKKAQGGLVIGKEYSDLDGNVATYKGGDPKQMSSWSFKK
jgi:hypothetical protein